MKHLITAMIMAGLIFVQIPSAIAGMPLGSAQLKSLTPGHYKVTLLGVSNMTDLLRGNGTIFGVAKGEIDEGHWRLSGNKICIAWNKWLGSGTRCSSLILERLVIIKAADLRLHRFERQIFDIVRYWHSCGFRYVAIARYDMSCSE